MKKFLLLIMCLFLTLGFAGCGKGDPLNFDDKITMQVVVTPNSISQNFSFPIFAEHFTENGNENVESYISTVTKNISDGVWKNMFLNYFAVYSLNPNEKFTPGGKQFEIEEAKYNSSYDRIEFSFKFNSMDCWEYYHPSDEEDEKPNYEGFIQTSTSEGVFPFSQQSENQLIGEKYAALITDAQAEFFTSEQIASCPKLSFCYDYVTYHKRVHSNADKIVQSGDYYHHAWISSQEDLALGKTIKLETKNAVRGWWYLLVLCIGIVAVVVAFVIIWIKEKDKNEKIVKKEG